MPFVLSRVPRGPDVRSSVFAKQGPFWALEPHSAAPLLSARRTTLDNHAAHVARPCHVSMAGRKWQGGTSEDAGGEEPGMGRKQQRGSGKRPQVAEDDEEFTEDIGGGASSFSNPVPEQPEPQADEEEAWHVTRGPGRQQARASGSEAERGQQVQSGEGEPGVVRWGKGRGKPNWRGPREGLSTSEVEQRLAVGGDIKDAADWHALASFVHRQGELMDAEQAVMVLTKLSCCPQRSSKAGGRVFRLQPSSVEAMQAAFGRPTDEEAAQQYDQLLSLLLGWILVLIPSFRPRHVSRCLAALDHMQLFNLEVTTALKDAVVKHLINFDLADYGTITATFAKFGYNPGPEFLELFTRKTARKLQLMSADELGKAAFGLSAMGCLPCPEWSEAFWKASYEKAPEFAGRVTATKELLMAVSYFAQAGQQPSQEWVDAVFGVLPMGRPNQPPRVTLISMLLYTLSNLSCRPSLAWCNVILEAWRRQLNYCSPSDLGTISLYVGRYLGVPVSQRLGSQLLRATLVAADKMGADEIAAVAYLLGVSQLQGSERDVDDLVHLLKQRLHECSSASREMLCSALPSLETGSELRNQELKELLEAAAKWEGKGELVVPEPVGQTVSA